ncbi:2-polyprenyl-6-methoxyphenol hydroxylase-like FAD-dependent oxidoreductase [Pseudonocardia eucalypti]|uniref:FAD-dependent monooxygenase n=1 Tax=Pseudonocardia eucalypti TaxID=648755 RepID=UPI00160D8E1E|nr:2-polyprenyl-6-methoxyphenol hydroxylase-like FAD-dependent oxidoreductase [Pseudonocardia eucalypti]
MSDTEVPVLIVGGGPVGLTARALLGRWGVRSLLVEKYRELSPFPRSRLLNVRSMEIFRQLGIAGRVAAAAFAPEYARVRFRETLGAEDFASAPMLGVHAPVPESPALGAVTSQDRLEPILLGAADTRVRFGAELVDLAEETDHVVASLVDDGTERKVRARYVIAADGANSTVREWLGIDTLGPGAVGSFTTVVFNADLRFENEPGGAYFTTHGSFTPIYPEGGWAWFGPTPAEPRHADWRELVTRALGPGIELPIDVLRVQHWVMNAFVASRFAAGRVLLAGDAVHAIPPIGGLGMNVGLADVHNLCWKLAGVLHGWAGPGLLDSYQAERLPVARETLELAVANSQLVRRVQQQRVERPEAPVEVPWTRRYFAQLGLVLGAAYESDAVLPDGSVAPSAADPVTDYLPTARPGHRLPHQWLAEGRSTLDILGEWFTLLTADLDCWRGRVGGAAPLRVTELTVEQASHYELGPGGAVLVRPDGYVAARWPDAPAGDALRSAISVVTSGAGDQVAVADLTGR